MIRLLIQAWGKDGCLGPENKGAGSTSWEGASLCYYAGRNTTSVNTNNNTQLITYLTCQWPCTPYLLIASTTLGLQNHMKVEETSKKIFQGNQPFLEMNYGVNLPIIFSSVC
jgi:hypothetical protein